jgi:hypothetical protein
MCIKSGTYLLIIFTISDLFEFGFLKTLSKSVFTSSNEISTSEVLMYPSDSNSLTS